MYSLDKANRDAIRRGLLKQLGYAERLPLNLDETEWSPEFEQLCRDLLVMGAFRYGRLGDKGKPQFDRMSDIENRVRLYRKTGNVVYLADIANMARLEFVEGKHPLKHLNADGDGYHTRIVR